MATVNEKMTAIADAIREKTGGTEPLGLDAMAQAIAALETGGGLPANIKAISSGIYKPPQQMSKTVTITHNMGVQPDFVMFIRSDDAITGYNYVHMLYTIITRRKWRYSSSTKLAAQVIYYHSDNDSTNSTRSMASTESDVENWINTETFSILATSSYPITFSDYVWVCCAFENYNAG